MDELGRIEEQQVDTLLGQFHHLNSTEKKLFKQAMASKRVICFHGVMPRSNKAASLLNGCTVMATFTTIRSPCP
jgi:hypothetical protein